MCIGCGADHPAGLHMRLWAGPGMTIEGEVTIDRNHQGAPGIAHGGLLSTVMDEILGAVNYLLWRPSVTVRLEVQFLRPVAVGSRLALRSELLGIEGRKVFARGRATLVDGDAEYPAVDAEGLFLHVPLEHFREHGESWRGDHKAGHLPELAP
jgi:acyl-coenzyme A thioesterase PaaI-like protein